MRIKIFFSPNNQSLNLDPKKTLGPEPKSVGPITYLYVEGFKDLGARWALCLKNQGPFWRLFVLNSTCRPTLILYGWLQNDYPVAH